MSQVDLLSTWIVGYNWCNCDSLWLDKCPNLKCQSALEGIWTLELQETELHDCNGILLQWKVVILSEEWLECEGADILNL